MPYPFSRQTLPFGADLAVFMSQRPAKQILEQGGYAMNHMQNIIVGNDLPLPPQILLMEDEPSVAKGLRMVLTDEG